MFVRCLLWGCIVLGLGNLAGAGDDQQWSVTKAAFLTATKKKQPPERVAATTALGDFPRKEAVDLLLKKGCVDSDSNVRLAARKTLTRLAEDESVREALLEEWKHGVKKPPAPWADQLRALAATASETQQDEILDGLNTLLSNPHGDFRGPIAVIDDFAEQGDEQAFTAVKLLSRVPAFQTKFAYRRAIIQALARIKSKDAISVLIESLEKSQGLIQSDIIVALTRITGMKYRDKFEDWKVWWQLNKEKFEYPAMLGPPYDPNDPQGASFYGIPICAKKVLFVLDTSASMRGEPIIAAKKALLATIEALPQLVQFDVITFDREVYTWQRKLVPATRDAKAEISEIIKMRGLGGGTSSFKALRAAFELEPEAIYFLSDGEPTDGGALQIIDAMSNFNRIHRISIFTVGVVTDGGRGDGLTRFMSPLAEQNWGLFRLVE